MNTYKRLGIIFLILVNVECAQARVFSFENESLAPYLKIRSGMTSMGSSPYQWQSASTYSGDEVDLIYGGEFGVYLRSYGFGVSLGVLVHTFDPVSGGRGVDASNAQLFSVEMEGMSYGPQLAFDFQFAQTESYLWKFIVGGGYLFSKIESTYNFSAAGQTLVGGQTSLSESYKQEAPFAMMAISTEFVMSGSTTLSVTAGYHYSLSDEWNYGQGGRNFSGAYSQGEKVLFENGTAKTINWSYPFIQLGFQFYVDKVR